MGLGNILVVIVLVSVVVVVLVVVVGNPQSMVACCGLLKSCADRVPDLPLSPTWP